MTTKFRIELLDEDGEKLDTEYGERPGYESTEFTHADKAVCLHWLAHQKLHRSVVHGHRIIEIVEGVLTDG